jgi:hypothetical protein
MIHESPAEARPSCHFRTISRTSGGLTTNRADETRTSRNHSCVTAMRALIIPHFPPQLQQQSPVHLSISFLTRTPHHKPYLSNKRCKTGKKQGMFQKQESPAEAGLPFVLVSWFETYGVILVSTNRRALSGRWRTPPKSCLPM